jgi:hypothetical protein
MAAKALVVDRATVLGTHKFQDLAWASLGRVELRGLVNP